MNMVSRTGRRSGCFHRPPNKRMNPTPKALSAFGTLASLGADDTQR